MSRTEQFELPLAEDPERQVLGHLTLPDRDGSATPVPVVILAHGYKSPLEWGWFPELQERLASAGLASLVFLHSYSGLTRTGERVEDEGVFARNTYSRELEDLALVRHWLAEGAHAIDARRIGLYGFSRGGGMGLLHAAERGDYAAVALWAPMDRVLKFAPEALELWRTRGWTLVTEYSTGRKLRLGPELFEDAERNRERLDILAAAARLRAPVLLVEAERDVIASRESLGRLAEALPAGTLRQRLFPGVGHTFGFNPPRTLTSPALEEALELTVGHFESHLGAGRKG